MSRLEPARRHELLAHLLERLRLDWERPLDAVAERRRNPVEVADEPAHPVRHQRERVVGSLQGVVEGEVLLDHPCSQHVGDERHCDAVLVVGEPDYQVGEALSQRRDHVQVEILRLGRVRGGALEDAQLVVEREDRIDRALDVLHRATPRREEHRLPECRDMALKRRVAQVAGGELERGNVELGEQVGALEVEHSGEQRHAELACISQQLAILVRVQLQRFTVLAVRPTEAQLVLVRTIVELAGVERPVRPLLQLDGVHAPLRSGTDQHRERARIRPPPPRRSTRRRRGCQRRRSGSA